MAQEAFQNLYKGLSQTVSLAVMDGILTQTELTSIKSQGNNVGTQLSVLYQALNGLGGIFGVPETGGGGNGGNGGGQYTAGVATPVQYTFYISVNSQAFMGDQDDARTFGLQIWDVIQDELNRA